jgi:single-strand DNA-binding protein
MAKGTVNKVILIGRLGADPDIRYSQSGTAVAKISVATNDRVPAGEGNWEDRTEWHRVVAFGKVAERCGNFLSKGKQVYIEGRLRTNQWEDAQGVKRYTTEIVAQDFEILSSIDARAAGESSGQGGGRASAGPATRDSQSLDDDLPPPPSGMPEDDIPF